MRLLMVEDDAELAQAVRDGLREHGMDTTLAGSVPQGRQRAVFGQYDVIVLDVPLPGGDVFALCRELPQRGLATAILMLTARDAVDARVRGLEAGADDLEDDGETWLVTCSLEQFDAVLMDIKMPGLDGVAAFKAMKARRPGIRVVLMTAYTAHDLIREAEREGALRVVSKPVDLAAVLPVLEESLSRSRSVLVVDGGRGVLL